MRYTYIFLFIPFFASVLAGENSLRLGRTEVNPGEEAHVPVWVQNESTVHGFSLAFAYEGKGLSVSGFIPNGEYISQEAVHYSRFRDYPEEGYAVLGVLFLWDNPSGESGFPPVEGEEACLGWLVFSTTAGTRSGSYAVMPQNRLGEPEINNTFSVNGGQSVLPSLEGGSISIRNKNTLRVTRGSGDPGDTVRLLVEVDHLHPLGGVQIALSYNSGKVRLRQDIPDSENPCERSINYCSVPLASQLSPDGVEQFILRVENDYGDSVGWAGCGMVFDYAPPYHDQVLPAGTGHAVLAAYFELQPEAHSGETVEIRLTDGLGNPPLNNKVLVPIYGQDGEIEELASVFPRKKNGTIKVTGQGKPFRRGFINGDARFDIADAVLLLEFIFMGSFEPGCMSAADTNDDGNIDVADAIRLLNRLFARGTPPLPEPFQECGHDSTPDSLTCLQGTPGC